MKIQMLVIALFLSFFSFAANIDETIVVSSVDRKVVVDYSTLEQIETTLTIRDKQGEILYKETNVRPSMLHNQFLFTEIEDETFVMTIENHYKVLESTYKLVEGKAVQLGTMEKTYKPVMVQKDEKVLINLMNPSNKVVTIKITNASGQALVTPFKSEEHVILKSLDFSQFQGESVVTLSVGDKKYVQNFSF